MPILDTQSDFTQNHTKFSDLLYYRFQTQEMPEKTSPFVKMQHQMLYQFMDPATRHLIQLNKRPMHIIPSNESHNHYLKFLEAYSNKNPEEEILSIQAFACHGMIMNGQQVAVANNFDSDHSFYEFIQAELNIRTVAPRLN